MDLNDIQLFVSIHAPVKVRLPIYKQMTLPNVSIHAPVKVRRLIHDRFSIKNGFNSRTREGATLNC